VTKGAYIFQLLFSCCTILTFGRNRLDEIKLEPGGAELLAFHTVESSMVDLTEISRQDHAQVTHGICSMFGAESR